MWQKLIEFIGNLLNKNKQLHSSFLLSDEEVERRIEQQENNLKLLHETIGSNPLDQIDWIIDNGYDKYLEKYSSYKDGSIGMKDEEFNVVDTASTIGSYRHKIEEAMNIGFVKGTLEDKIKSSVSVHPLVIPEKRLKEDFTLTLDQAVDFHERTNKGTSLETVYRQVKNELDLYSIEFNTDNENILSETLKRAVSLFHTCKTSLELDENKRYFKEDLREKEKIILSKWMAYHYVDNLVRMERALSNLLTTKDYRMFSIANEFRNLQYIAESIEDSVVKLQWEYNTANEEYKIYGNLFS